MCVSLGPPPTRSALSVGTTDRPYTRYELELVLAVSAVLLVATICSYIYRNRQLAAERQAEKESSSVVLPSSSQPPVCQLCVHVGRAKGLSTGRMFKASVRVTVISDRIAHVERKQTAVRNSVYSPTGFSVDWYEDLNIPVVCEDCTVSVEMVEHILAHPGGTIEEQVLATTPPWNAMQDPSVSDNGWHALTPARVDYTEQVEGATLKLKLVRHTSHTLADGASVGAPFGARTSEELADALLQASKREDAIRACLEHTQKIMMGAASAAPMTERKPVYQQATTQLATLASQPLCVSSAWNTDAGRAAAHGVGDLMYQVFNSPASTNRQVDVRRGARFVRTVELGPEYAKMYGILASREEMSACITPESQDGPAALPEPDPRQPDLLEGVIQPAEFQADNLGGHPATHATTANPVSFSAVDDDV